MYDVQATLVIDINAFGLEPTKRIQYKFMTFSLSYLDSITYAYLNAESFFKEKHAKILEKLQHSYKEYGMQIAPTAIEMGPNKIYIIKSDQKEIQAIFQTINKNDSVYGLEDLVKKRMYNGNLKMLYLCDKEEQRDPDYLSIFSTIPPLLLQKLEVDIISKEDVELFWQYLKVKPEHLSLIRLFLLKGTDLEKREMYQLEIRRLAEHVKGDHLKNKISDEEVYPKNTRLYRFPYNDEA